MFASKVLEFARVERELKSKDSWKVNWHVPFLLSVHSFQETRVPTEKIV